jgi:hypothetical protein
MYNMQLSLSSRDLLAVDAQLQLVLKLQPCYVEFHLEYRVGGSLHS